MSGGTPRFLRVGGRGSSASGASIIWSVAEGRRGRRWREIRRAGEGIGHSLLLETRSGWPLQPPRAIDAVGPADAPPRGETERSTVMRSSATGSSTSPGSPGSRTGSSRSRARSSARLAAAGLLRPVLDAGASRAHHAVRSRRRSGSRSGRSGSREPPAAAGSWERRPRSSSIRRGLPELTGGETWPLERDSGDADGAVRRLDRAEFVDGLWTRLVRTALELGKSWTTR